MRKYTINIIIFFLFLIVFPWHCHAIESWPGGSGTTIATYSDASGAVWNETRQSLFVVQNSGTLVEIDSEGTELDSWSIPGDLEGITLAGNDRYLYIGIENPDSIVEFDLNTEALTGDSWDLTTWMASVDPNQGLEGLAYRDGYFLAGIQEGGLVYIFDVNVDVSDDVSLVDTFTPFGGYGSDVSGIEYSEDTGIAYVIYDSFDALVELNSSNQVVEHYGLPGTAQEGFTLVPNCMERKAIVYIANDDTGAIVKYSDYPITCLDADGDGVDYASDCNDYDASISANRNYYRDADGDGLGASTPTPFCSLIPPAGYVTNNNDANDNDRDNDGSQIGTDCNDNDSTISVSQTYWRDADTDGLGDAFTTTQFCAFTAPGGYVANSSDPVDIVSNGRSFYVNGGNHDFFTVDPTTVEYADFNFYGDDWHEIIAVELVTKRAYITLARVRGNEVAVTKRVRVKIKKKHKSVSISINSAKNKFTTRFSRGKKYTWKVKSSGSFKKSR